MMEQERKIDKRWMYNSATVAGNIKGFTVGEKVAISVLDDPSEGEWTFQCRRGSKVTELKESDLTHFKE